MAKRKITVTVDEGLLETVQDLGNLNLSSVVNEALGRHVDRLARRAALGQLLDSWDVESEKAAAAAFDDLDAGSVSSSAA
jgi:post-segregation antitoxin (ccd killing protein)